MDNAIKSFLLLYANMVYGWFWSKLYLSILLKSFLSKHFPLWAGPRNYVDVEESATCVSLKDEKKKDPRVMELIQYLEDGILSRDEKQSPRVVAWSTLFVLVDGVLFYIDHKRDHQKRSMVSEHLRESIMQSVPGGPFSGHFSGYQLFKVFLRKWW